MDADITSATTPANGTKDGEVVHTAKVTFEGRTYTNSRTETLPTTGESDLGLTPAPKPTPEPTPAYEVNPTEGIATVSESHTFTVSVVLPEPYNGHKAGEIITIPAAVTEDGVQFTAYGPWPVAGLAWASAAEETPEPKAPAPDIGSDAAVWIGVGATAAVVTGLVLYQNRAFLPVWKLGGIVTLADETPVANATIVLTQGEKTVKTLTTNASGSFTARVLSPFLF